jgi:peptidoglycan/LPS O-acetylase OafA/YrhL
MSKATSVFLDILRVVAALVVFVGHCTQFWSGELFQVMKHVGHDAVVVFFVLSGYVIAFSALGKARDGKSYALARLSRLYSVVLPALVLTFVLQWVGTMINPAFYAEIVRPHDGLRMVLSGLFLQEAWTISASPATNLPLWSLGYEFWYYALFGAAVFVSSWRWKITVMLGMALLVGYKVLLLMPIWLLGVALYIYGRKIKVAKWVAQIGFVMAMTGFFAAVRLLPDYPVGHGFYPWFYSGAFISDFATGLLLTAAIGCFDLGFSGIAVPASLERSVRWVADHTFSLYLYHFPLVIFATAWFHIHNPGVGQAIVVMTAILVIIVGLSLLTESKRRAWHQGITAIWNWFEGRLKGGSGRLKGRAGAPSL